MEYSPRRRDIGLIFLCFVLAFCTYGIPTLFTPDEGRYAEISREMLVYHQWLVPHINGLVYFEKPPLVYWVIAFCLKVFGLSNWAVRLPNILFSLGSCYLTYFCCCRIWHRQLALRATLIMMTCLLFISMGRYLTLDIGVTFFINATLLLFLTSTTFQPGKQKTALLWGAYLCSGLAIMSKGLIGIVFPIMIIGLWILLLNRWRELTSMRLISGLIIVVAVSLPWAYLVQQHYPGFMHFYFITQQFTRYLTPIASREMNKAVYIGAILASMLPWTILLFHSARGAWQKRRQDAALVFCLIWPLAIMVFFGLSHSILLPYLLPTLLPMAILIAHWMGERLHKTCWVLVIDMILFANAAWLVASHFTHTSAKPLTTALQPYLKQHPNAFVATYEDYFQDVPFYLQRFITMVNYTGEFAQGHRYASFNPLPYTNLTTFWQHWDSKIPAFVFMDRIQYDRVFVQHRQHCGRLIARTPKLALVQNCT